MPFDVVTIGGITEDIMFHTKEMKIFKNKVKGEARTLFAFEAGDKIVSDKDVLYTAGGGGANTAVSLSKLGLKASLFAAIGDDRTGVKLIYHLKKNKVHCGNLQIIKNYWSGLSLVVTSGNKNDHIIFTHRAANEKLKLSFKKISLVKTKWFYLTSLKGSEWQNNLEIVFKAARKTKAQIAWNPGSVQLDASFNILKRYLAKTKVLILNREEAFSLVKNAGKRVKTIRDAIKTISYFGPEIISVTDGAKGAYIYSDGEYQFEKSLPFKAINTTGAGDAFGSSLIGGLVIYKNDLAKALKLAIIRSNYVIRKIGAQEGLLSLAQVKEKYNI